MLSLYNKTYTIYSLYFLLKFQNCIFYNCRKTVARDGWSNYCHGAICYLNTLVAIDWCKQQCFFPFENCISIHFYSTTYIFLGFALNIKVFFFSWGIFTENFQFFDFLLWPLPISCSPLSYKKVVWGHII